MCAEELKDEKIDDVFRY